jgi:hypothetical protein
MEERKKGKEREKGVPEKRGKRWQLKRGVNNESREGWGTGGKRHIIEPFAKFEVLQSGREGRNRLVEGETEFEGAEVDEGGEKVVLKELPKVRWVREGGRWFTGRLKCEKYTKRRWVSVRGRESTGYENRIEGRSVVRNGGRCSIG